MEHQAAWYAFILITDYYYFITVLPTISCDQYWCDCDYYCYYYYYYYYYYHGHCDDDDDDDYCYFHHQRSYCYYCTGEPPGVGGALRSSLVVL